MFSVSLSTPLFILKYVHKQGRSYFSLNSVLIYLKQCDQKPKSHRRHNHKNDDCSEGSPTGRGIDNIVRSCVPCLLPLPFSPHPTWRQRLSPVGKEKKSLCVFLCPSVTEESYLPGTGPASQDTFQWSEGIQGAPWLSQVALVIFLPTTRPFFKKSYGLFGSEQCIPVKRQSVPFRRPVVNNCFV